MRRWLLAAALIGGCARSPEISYDQLLKEFRAGRLMAVRSELDRDGGRWWKSLAGERLWRFRLLHVEILLGQADYKQARALLESYGAAPTPELETRRLANLADVYSRLTLSEEAWRIAADASARARAGGWQWLIAHTTLLESALLIRSGRTAEASAALERLVRECAASNDAYHLAAARINLARLALRQSDWDTAVNYSQQAYADARRAGASRIAGLAAVNLGVAYSLLGDFDRAKQAQQAAVESTEVTGDKRAQQAALGELGTIYLREDNLPEAAKLIERAFRVADESGLSAEARRWASNLAVTLNIQKDWAGAERWNRTARTLAEADDPSALPYLDLNESVTAIGQGNVTAARATLARLRPVAAQIPALAWQVEEALAHAAKQAGDTAAANGHFEAALSHVDRAAGELRQDQFRVTLRARLISFHRNYVQSLLEQGRTERALEVAESSRAQLLAERLGRKVTASKARDMLARAVACRCTLLSYWLAPARSVVWVVHPRGITLENLPALANIDRAVAAYRRELLEGFDDPLLQPAGTQLAAALLAPVQKHLPPGSRVVIAPDGAMHNVNLEALPVGGDPKHYWIEDVTVAIAPSLALLEVARFERPRSALLLGAPTFASDEFPALRHASEELRTVQSRLSRASAKCYEGAAATPAAYLEEAPRRPSVVHFAAHGDVRYEHPFDSAIVLSGSGGSERLSGRQIAQQPLAADLVTVSACKSAGARTFAGEGLTGLAWTFLQSGARRVVAGSWDVSDQSSTRLMDRLYQGVNDGEDPMDSLRQAKLALLNSGTGMRHPFYWAALQMFVRVIAPAREK